MKNLFLSLTALLFAFALFSCSESALTSNSSIDDGTISNPKEGNITTKGGNIITIANPVIVYLVHEYQTKGGPAIVDNMYVMNEDGSNKTKLMTINPYVHRQWIYPRWAPAGINTIYYGARGNNFTWNGSVYSSNAVWLTDISVVNNKPKASKPRKIWDGSSNYSSCYDRAWNPNPNSNQIAIIVLYKPIMTRSIMLIPTNGNGVPTTIYTEGPDFWMQWLTFSPNGDYIAFARNNSSSKSIRVIERTSGNVVKDIDLSQFTYVGKLDWGRSLNSPIIAFHGTLNGINNMYTLDLSTNAISLAFNNGTQTAMGSYSPDDSKMVYSNVTSPSYWEWEIRIYNFLTGTTSNVLAVGGEFSSWKR
ncbi:MAG: hypothetical protein A2X61_08345 [Ignavibacteria bacterium GWB2_35_12]|nr:MAG: hypothetical protein A2X61_08345 [Ignavibacteria bacterium GWB2_35_12]OGV24173.1 MAG: hypothetical protein A2475_11865 [Ignavibacteria bacterium RIFOXYC2_FULL_35_21]